MAAVVRGGELAWAPHRLNQKILTKPLLTKEKHGAEATVVYVYVPAGEGVPEHVHDEQDDIVYLVSGEIVVWVDGLGEVRLSEGDLVRVPKGTKHWARAEKDSYVLDVFVPPLL